MNLFPHRLATVLAVAILFAAAAVTAVAQQPPTAIVSIYRIAPGKQLAFLKWMAARDASDRDAGIAPTQWYRHMDGDSWDYIGIAPNHYAAQDSRSDEMARKHGLSTGMKAGLELRELLATHTDTIAAGPSTAAELVQQAGQP